MSFFKLLEERVKSIDSLLCVGLDPHCSQLSEPTASAAVAFCKDIIENTYPFAAAYKPNIAFFEVFGEKGMLALNQVISLIPSGIPIILDCKRGDIDTTAQAYAQAAYDVHNASAVTLSPYMGWDSIKFFVTGKYSEKGAFILCKTSNMSSKELQDLSLSSGKTIYEQVASLSMKWNQDCSGNLGLVVGATDVSALKKVRVNAPSAWILCPGVGAQGGDALTVCNAGLRKDGLGLLVSVSRGISAAANKSLAAQQLRDEINSCRGIALASSISASTHIEQYQSGRISPYFFNAGLFDDGMSMALLGKYYAQAIRSHGLEFDVIFGPAYKGIPLATAISIAWYHLYGESKDVTYNRKEAKDHGEGGNLVGAKMNSRRVLIVDDVITAGTAIRESALLLQSQNALLVGIVVSLDRQERVSEDATESAIQSVETSLEVPVVSIIKLKDLISYLQSTVTTVTDLETVLPLIIDYRKKYGVDY